MPLRFHRRRILALLLPVAVGGATALSAQDYSGEYALMTEGQTVLAVTLIQAGNGKLTGSVMSGDKTLPVVGSVRNGVGNFVSAGPSGGFLQWSAQLRADSLAATLVPTGADGRPDPAQAQYHMLVRLRAPGEGAKRARGSQKWLAALVTAADSVLSWCARPDYAGGGFCRNLLPVVQRIGPALMVTRLALGGGPGAAPAVAGPAPGFPPAAPAAATPGRSLLAAVGAGSPPPAPASYDFALVSEGTVVLAIALTVEPDGTATGTVTAGANTVTLAGAVTGTDVRFTTTAPDGTATEWTGTLSEGALTVSLPGPDGEETYELTVRER